MSDKPKPLTVLAGPDGEILIEDQHGRAPNVLRDAGNVTLRVGDVVAVAVVSGRSSATQVLAKLTGTKAYVGYVRVLLEPLDSKDNQSWYGRKVSYRVPNDSGRLAEVVCLATEFKPD